jgi:hypothetical protein
MKKQAIQRKKAGRPPLPADKARSVRIIFRAELALYERIRGAAEQAGKPAATWIRDTLTDLLSE